MQLLAAWHGVLLGQPKTPRQPSGCRYNQTSHCIRTQAMKHLVGRTWSVTAALSINVAVAGFGNAAAAGAVGVKPTAHTVQAASLGSRAAIVERLRTELATLL